MTAPSQEEFATEMAGAPHPENKAREYVVQWIAARDAALLAPLRAEVERLREALRPFARIIADNVLGPQRSDGQKFTLAEAKDDDIDFNLTVSDFRAAARALAEGQT